MKNSIEKAVDKFIYERCIIVGNKKEQKMMKKIYNDTEYYVWEKGLIKFAEKLIEAERNKLIKEYTEKTIPHIINKWRGYLKKEKKKWIEEIEKLVLNEISIAQKEGKPTSRLTSLSVEIEQLKRK